MNYEMLRHFHVDVIVPYMLIIGLCYGVYYIVTNPDKVFPLSHDVNPILILYVSIIMFVTRLCMFYLELHKNKKVEVDNDDKRTTKMGN